MADKVTTWYVLVRKENGYPLLIYADKERAEQVALTNGSKVVPVQPCGEVPLISDGKKIVR